MTKEPFDEEMRKVINGLGRDIAIKSADILKDSYVTLLEDNPFWSGQLVYNWLIGIGESNYDVEYFEETADGVRKMITREEAIGNASKQIPKLDEFELGTIVHFFNNIDYAQWADTNSGMAGFISRGQIDIWQDLNRGLEGFFKNYTYSEVPF
jgi:hypothetical protein